MYCFSLWSPLKQHVSASRGTAEHDVVDDLEAQLRGFFYAIEEWCPRMTPVTSCNKLIDTYIRMPA